MTWNVSYKGASKEELCTLVDAQSGHWFPSPARESLKAHINALPAAQEDENIHATSSGSSSDTGISGQYNAYIVKR